ncbi:PrpF domain-containing protein [Nocardioides sp. CER19]|uniref:PrpF domain-containing protein n=1 Tax=Nocardioides sp. CER19 TaxID=3038538 RepID=UPI00244A63EF|nr:PrpF domain-containing protein [Nocardioides sp. CER19]MDH2412555.1 PrpF domain-containing protein [Nocardioides sp. CER19]
MSGLRCALMRGGTSRGAFLLADDLPVGLSGDTVERDDLLLRIMGGPDALQVDGLGGGHPLTSKVAVVATSATEDVDVDYLFLQVVPDLQVVTTAQPCGNMLAGVGPFAIERGLVQASGDVTEVRVRMVNTGTVATLRVQTPGGVVTYDGDTAISGVPGTAAPVEVVLAPSPHPLLPTGHLVDTLAGVEVTCIDNGMPCVLVRAADLGVDGTERPEQLEDDAALTERVRAIRAEALTAMGLDPNPDATSVPKIVLLSAPQDGGVLSTRSFIPVRVHRSIGVVAAATVAAGAAFPGTVAHDLAKLPPTGEPMRLEHPTGFLAVGVETDPHGHVTRTAVVRTARMILDGVVHPRPPRTTKES